MAGFARPRDPLLFAAKTGTILVRIGLVIGMIAIGIAGAVSAIGGSRLAEHIKVSIEPASLGETRGLLVLMLLGVLITLGLIYDFVTQLARIIDTVAEGDPFTLENSRRLRRMGWLTVAVVLISLPSRAVSNWMEPQLAENQLSFDSDGSLTAIALAIVLFILARVFRKGTEMREELEGTV